ncbi:MAG: branched-chain amino acid ABC transporter permease, partial [Aggregatilineales bacterium]
LLSVISFMVLTGALYAFLQDRADFALILGIVGIILGASWRFIAAQWRNSRVDDAGNNQKPHKEKRQHSVPRSVTLLIPYIVLIMLLFMLPFVADSFLSQTMFTVGLYVLMGLGLNMAVGLAGLLDLGYVTNYAVGAYIAAYLTSTGPLGFGANGGIEMTIWMVIPIALIAAMLTGFLFALPVLRMRGDYLAIATLGFGEIIGKLAVSDWFKPVIGGAQGLKQIANPPFLGTTFSEPEQFYYIVLVICIIMIFVSVRLNNSRIGRQWMAIREDEDAASAMGINTARAKLLAFTISAAIGGVAGAVFASSVGAVFPNSFTLIISLNVLSIIIVGGMGSIPGIILGAFFLIGMPEILREFNEYRFLIYGVLLVVMMLVRPEGLWPSSIRQREMQNDDPDPTLT